MADSEFILKLAGVFLGVVTRSILPWLRKWKAGEVSRFEPRYLLSAAVTLGLGIVITLLIFPQFTPSAGGRDLEALFRLFAMAFGFGFGWNAIVLEAGEWAGAFRKAKAKA